MRFAEVRSSAIAPLLSRTRLSLGRCLPTAVSSKKKPAPAAEVAAPPDPRECLEPTPANLKAVLAQLELVLADVPVPPPPAPPKPPEPPPVDPAAATKPPAAEARPSEVKSSEGRPAAARARPPVRDDDEDDEDDDEDLADLPVDEAEVEPVAAPAKVSGGEAGNGGPAAVVADAAAAEPVPAGPETDLVEAMLHFCFAEGMPCGYGQEARRRIRENFVDRNEFRVTEAYEVEDLLHDLEIPHLFERCQAVRDAIGQIYNDQNGVQLGFLRNLGVADRSAWFQRAPALPPHVVHHLGNLLTLEEICFSDKSTLRAQQRFGLDPKDEAVGDFLNRVRVLLAPYRGLPLEVGKDLPRGKVNLTHALSPASLLLRLGPPLKASKKK